MVVDHVKVIKDDEELASRVALEQASECIHDFGQTTQRLKYPVEVIAMNVVEGQEVFDAVRAVAGWRASVLARPFWPSPRRPWNEPRAVPTRRSTAARLALEADDRAPD